VNPPTRTSLSRYLRSFPSGGFRFPGSAMIVADPSFQRPALFLRKISLPVAEDYGTRTHGLNRNICVQIEGLVWKWREDFVRR
jgi:hypothetical protein